MTTISSPANTTQQHRGRPIWLFVVLAIATLAAYRPAWHGGVLWDDDAHLTPHALASWAGLGRTWIDFTVSQQYYPVVSTAFWSMNALWGHDTLGYHIVNILLHTLSACLIALLLRRWSLPGGTIAAVLFALHPVHVESVAWITEMKNTLSGVFYLLAALVYLGFDATRSRSRYAMALALYVLALGSKTVAATLPAALLVVIWWRRGRIEWRRDIVPLVPLFALGIAAGLLTAWIEYTWVGASGDRFALTWIDRPLIAGRAIWFYLGKLLWPQDLVFIYPRWTIDQTVWWQYLWPLAFVAATVGLWLLRRRNRGLLAATLLFAGTLAPALGFANVYAFRFSFVADHWQYLASASVLGAIAVGLARLGERLRPGLPEAVIALVVGLPLFVLTLQQSRQYVSADTLYRTTLAANPEAAMVHNNLAVLLLAGPPTGWAEATAHAETAVRLTPNDPAAHNNLGLAWQRQGRFADSEREVRAAIQLDPRLASAHANLGLALAGQGKFAEAVPAHEESLRLTPDSPEVLHDFSRTLAQMGRSAEALARIQQAVQLQPDSANLQLDLANTLQANQQLDAAIEAYRAALALQPDWGEAYHNLAIAQCSAGRQQEAVATFATAERLLPNAGMVLRSFGLLLASLGRLDEASTRFERALATADPRMAADLHYQLGMLRSRQGRGDEARDHFAAALRLQPDFAAARQQLEHLQGR